MATATEALAAFAAGVRGADLPDAVVATLKRHLLDTVGVALASSSMPFAVRVLRAVDALSAAGTAGVLGHDRRLPPSWAALVNGTFAHGIDFDDTHTESVVHVSTSVVPATLAMLADHPGDGRRILQALAVGMESNIRIGLVARGAFHDRGFHPTGICGTFASALVAGLIAGHDETQMADALGLCASTAAGSLEFLSDGSSAKRIHGGWAAHAGITAAHLGAAGFSGPRGALDGRFGLYRSHLGEGVGDLDVLTRDLGQRWHLLDTALKPYPCCHFNHAFIDAAKKLCAQRSPRLRLEEIRAITCFVAAAEMPIVCEPAETKRSPQTPYDAKFSLPYTVACAIARGDVGIDDFDDASIGDGTLLALAARVTCLADPEADYPRRFPGRVRIELDDGQILEHAEPINRGSAERPLTDDEVTAKFMSNATRTISIDAAQRIRDAIAALEAEASPSRLLGLLSAGAR